MTYDFHKYCSHTPKRTRNRVRGVVNAGGVEESFKQVETRYNRGLALKTEELKEHYSFVIDTILLFF